MPITRHWQRQLDTQDTTVGTCLILTYMDKHNVMQCRFMPTFASCRRFRNQTNHKYHTFRLFRTSEELNLHCEER